MEQNLSLYDLEYMKLAMLKQENLFKHQVHELHRLYRIQKLLMRTPQRKVSKNEDMRVPNEKKQMRNLLLELEKPSEYCSNNMEQLKLLDHFGQNDRAVELTLGLGTACYNSQTSDHNNNKLSATTRLLTSDSLMSFSSSSTGSCSHSKKACIRRLDGVVYQEHLRQHDGDQVLEQPPWLLQVLSLNMTNS